MNLKSLIYSPISILRNAAFFLLGTSFYISIFGMIDLQFLIIPLVGFVMAYNSVYYLNDILDYKTDIKNKIKRKVKPLASGKISKTNFIIIYLFYLLSGLALSFTFNITFGLIVVSLLLFNILHSTLFRKRKFLTSINLAIIEFLKIFLGWFVFSHSIAKLPILFMIAISLLYSLVYNLYKSDSNEIMSKHKYDVKSTILNDWVNLLLITIIIFSFTYSFFIYNFIIPILAFPILFLFNLVIFNILKPRGNEHNKITTGLKLSHIFVVIDCALLSLVFVFL